MKRLILFAILSAVSIVVANQTTIPYQELQWDLSYLVDVVDKCHVSPWQYISREDFMKIAEEIKQKLDHPMSRTDFYKEIIYLLHYISDVHTFARLPTSENILVFPFIPHVIDSRIFVVHDGNNLSLAPFEILKIDGKDAKDIIREMNRYTPFSTYRSLSSFFWLLPTLWDKKEFHILIKHDNERREIVVKAITLQEFEKIKKQFFKDEKYYQFTRRGNIGILRIKSFAFAIGLPEKLKEFSEFLTKVFSENKDMTDLIIDVRDNPGGSWDAPLEIISHFIDKPLIINADMYTKACEYAQEDLAAIGIRYSKELEGEIIKTKRTFTAYPKKPIFKGNVWALVNKDVFSGGKFFVYVIQKYRLGKVIGEKLLTDANITLWRPFMLPYSHLEVYIPTRMVFFGKNIEIIPDYEITLTDDEKEQFALGKSDPMLQKAIELIKSQTKEP